MLNDIEKYFIPNTDATFIMKNGNYCLESIDYAGNKRVPMVNRAKMALSTMNTIDCKDRVEAYFNNMNKYEKDINIHIRFLDKIFHAAMDYNNDEKIWVLNTLLKQSKKEKDLDYKILDLCYAYKINKINNLNLDNEIEVLKSKNMITASICSDLEIPKKVKDILKNKQNISTFKFQESLKPDEELLDLYNVKIARDHFYYKNVNVKN